MSSAFTATTQYLIAFLSRGIPYVILQIFNFENDRSGVKLLFTVKKNV